MDMMSNALKACMVPARLGASSGNASIIYYVEQVDKKMLTDLKLE